MNFLATTLTIRISYQPHCLLLHTAWTIQRDYNDESFTILIFNKIPNNPTYLPRRQTVYTYFGCVYVRHFHINYSIVLSSYTILFTTTIYKVGADIITYKYNIPVSYLVDPRVYTCGNLLGLILQSYLI